MKSTPELAPALVLLLLSMACASSTTRVPASEVVIRGGWLFDGLGDTRRANPGIVVRDGKIAALESVYDPRPFLELQGGP